MTPPQYVIQITGQISWEGQANGLPSEIHAYVIYEGDNTADINKIIEDQMEVFVRSQMMYVQRDQGQIIDLRMTPQERMAVPFHWIVTMHAKVRKMTGELSAPDEQGVERLNDGSTPQLQ